ncbi:MAG: hypothetical protein CL942_14385 [Desulfovibrio sp.]|nr:hypothetical protein [Desulfovibrio sp.]|tara:strand:- start:35676 stop:36350 length:675 start_codon:yes stop_codon:yes gene_type:complete
MNGTNKEAEVNSLTSVETQKTTEPSINITGTANVKATIDDETISTVKDAVIKDLYGSKGLEFSNKSIYTFFLKRIEVFVSALVVVVALLTAVNVYSGSKHAFRLRSEVEQLTKFSTDAKEDLNGLTTEYKNKIEGLKEEAAKLEAELIQNVYEATKISSYKSELLSLLATDAPDIQRSYALLGKIYKYPSRENLRIYSLCLEKFTNPQLIKVVRKGIAIMANDS